MLRVFCSSEGSGEEDNALEDDVMDKIETTFF